MGVQERLSRTPCAHLPSPLLRGALRILVLALVQCPGNRLRSLQMMVLSENFLVLGKYGAAVWAHSQLFYIAN